jgi:hypothetical protein
MIYQIISEAENVEPFAMKVVDKPYIESVWLQASLAFDISRWKPVVVGYHAA